jgi:SAM-dependent methyltransferase
VSSKTAKRASCFWDENVKLHEKVTVPMSWLDSPIVMEHCLQKLNVGGKCISVIQWVQWVKEKFAANTVFDYGLSLGCGDGTLERHALTLNICSRFDAFDISPKSIEAAKKQSIEQGLVDRINYHVADLNLITLESNKYDIVFSCNAIHHVLNLEHVFSMVRKSLKPDGLFIFVEYVGPSQFQWTDKQLRIINEILEILPEKLKVDARSGELKKPSERPTILSMNMIDPSEAIRSADIMSLVNKMWTVEERIDFGGNIAHMLLDGIVSNFSSSQEDVTILKLIEYLDDILIREGVFQSDFTVVIARNKPPDQGNDHYGINSEKQQKQQRINHNLIQFFTDLNSKFLTSLKKDGYRQTAIKTLLYMKRFFLYFFDKIYT